jgi:acetyl-CoA carboxylase biotin carboxyl carrier protein
MPQSIGAETQRPPETKTDSSVAINSPMVGTFYNSHDPESPPYVQVGSDVEPETVVCIIEAMKVYNEIRAEVSGVIEEVLVRNEDPVEFSQPLFKVRPRS